MTGNTILKDGTLLLENYGMDLNKLNQDDRVGLLRTSEVSILGIMNNVTKKNYIICNFACFLN